MPDAGVKSELSLKAPAQMQDLLDHGEARKKQEEAEFARIDAEAKEERDKQMGFRGTVRPLGSSEIAHSNDDYTHRSSMSWMVRTPSLPGQNRQLSMVSRIG